MEEESRLFETAIIKRIQQWVIYPYILRDARILREIDVYLDGLEKRAKCSHRMSRPLLRPDHKAFGLGRPRADVVPTLICTYIKVSTEVLLFFLRYSSM